jgi:hypothetical protein
MTILRPNNKYLERIAQGRSYEDKKATYYVKKMYPLDKNFSFRFLWFFHLSEIENFSDFFLFLAFVLLRMQIFVVWQIFSSLLVLQIFVG